MKLKLYALIALALGSLSTLSASAAAPLSQEAYIWQRSWNDAVRDAIGQSSPILNGYAALAAEVVWENGHPRVIRVPVDWATLQKTGKPFGIALRIGAFKGPFNDQDEIALQLSHLAAELIKQAGPASELQIDFDCATAKLAGYQVWATMLRHQIAPIPLIITVLPSWLKSPDFPPLVKATDGFVLQVHSLEQPSLTKTNMTLCDPQAARLAVQDASKIGIPFRVALPTYGYLVAFTKSGKILGLSAEGPSRTWPEEAVLQTMRADAADMAALNHEWSLNRPPNLIGVIWYRLPVAGDSLNWRWCTLAKIIGGGFPMGDLQVRLHHPQNLLTEIELFNNGAADAIFPEQVAAQCGTAEIVSADAVAGYERLDSDPHKFILRAKPSLKLQRLAPGEGRIISWLRLSADKELEVNVMPHL